ncbi:MAG: hypothetical protein H6712_21195 [Myxococcales bacterium]|nr:hypothetical protein [Myxococcales bacterium]
MERVAGVLSLVTELERHDQGDEVVPYALRHCTGQGLTSFFECLLDPGSLSEHDIELLTGSELSIVGQPGNTGTSATRPAATWSPASRATAPARAAVSPYEVCL